MKKLRTIFNIPYSIIKRSKRKQRLIALVILIIFLGGFVFSTLILRPEARADSLLKFDEGYGATVNDSSGAASGTITGATWKTEDLCYIGKCLYFDGNDWISFGDEVTYDYAVSADFTIEFWYRHSLASAAEVIIQKYESVGADGGYRVRMESDGDISFGVDDANGGFADDNITSTAATYDDNNWHHVAAVKDGTTGIYLYIDMVLVASDTSIGSTGDLTNNDTFYIGDSDGTDNADEYTGFLDEVKIYTSSARSEAEIKTDFTSANPDRGTAALFGPDKSYLSEGLVGYWRMDETSWTGDCTANSVVDHTGNGQNGKVCPNASGPTLTSGKFGNAGSFDGSNDNITIANSSVHALGSELTVSAWVYMTSLPSHIADIVIKMHSSSPWQSYELNYDNTNQKFAFTLANTNAQYISAYSQSAVQANTWYNVTGTFKNNTLTVYVNGVSGAPVAFTGTAPNADSNLHINSYGDPAYSLPGKIDEVRIYNRALSPSEVEGIYRWAPGPVGYWDLNENTGTTANDKSANTKTATITPGTGGWVNGKMGSGYSFDSSNTAIITNSTYSSPSTLTIEAWIYPKSLGEASQARIIAFDSAASRRFYLTSTNAIQFRSPWSTGSMTQPSTDNVFSFNQWQHIAVVYDGSSSTNRPTYYVNGVQVANGTDFSTNSGSISTQTDNWVVGNNETQANTFDGYMDEVKVYDYIRTPAQIIEDMNAGHPAPGSPVGSAIGYWKFDEGYQTTAYNSGSSGTSLNGTLTSGPAWTNSGKFGKAIDFDGDNDYVSVGDIDAIDGVSQVSYSAWVKLDTLEDYNSIISKNASGNTSNTWMGLSGSGEGSNNDAAVDVQSGSNTGGYTTGNVIATGVWKHWVMVFDGTQTGNANRLKFYLNGVQQNLTFKSGTVPATTASSTNPFRVGNANPLISNAPDGQIDEVKLFNVALTADQVKLLFNQSGTSVMGSLSTDSSNSPSNASADSFCPPGQGTACVGPTAEWKFDDKTGLSAFDTSGNNRTGTLTGGPTWSTGKIGSAIKLDGSNDSVATGVNSDNFITTSAGTIEAWVYFTGTGGSCNSQATARSQCRGIVGDSGGFFGITRGNLGGTDRIWFYNVDGGGTDDFVGVTYNTDTWYHLTWVHSGSVLYGYVNGILLGSIASGNTNNITNFLNMGVQDGEYFQGIIDNVRIFNYGRTAAQIAWDYNQGGPVAWYKFDECTGDTAYNSVLNGNGDAAGMNGVIAAGDSSGNYDSTGSCNDELSNPTNSMWNAGTTGKRNASIGFDGTNDSVTVTDPASGILDFGSGQTFSIAFWLKAATNGSSQTGITKRLTAGYQFWVATNCSPTCISQFRIDEGATNTDVVVQKNLLDSQWHHVVVGRDSSRAFIYVDGKLDNSTNDSTLADLSNSNNLEMGSEAGFSPLTGQIDEVRFYNYSLTAEQVRNDYIGGSVRFSP